MTADTAAHIEVRGVTKIFPARGGHGEVHGLGPVDIDIRRGEFFSVVGPSGCGKTTFLDALAGLSLPTAGSLTCDGKPVAGDVPEGVGVVFQQDASFAWLNVWENIAFGLRRNGMPAGEIARRVEYALGFMGLSAFAKSYPAQLSGGMRQRVCIARTLVLKPSVLLLDEPFAALDQQTRLLMGDELLRIWRDTGATVVLITHALDEAAMLSDRIGIMSARPGRFIDLVSTGWPRERDSRIVSDPRFGEITARLWAQLREESLRAIAPAPSAAEKSGH
jgi:NitT/TauT family transport system ATP-binding protein